MGVIYICRTMDERVGMRREVTNGYMVEIVEYNKSTDIIVKFLDNDCLKKTSWKMFKQGNIENPYHPSRAGVGYLVVGEYSPSNNKRAYKAWSHMIDRCYSESNTSYKYYGAIGVLVDSEWHNFQNYAKWYIENEIEGYVVDKDLLSVGIPVYSKETCIFIPMSINSFLINRKSSSNKTGIVGASITSRGTYAVYCNKFLSNDTVYLGESPDIDVAKNMYIDFKLKQCYKVYEYMLELGYSELIARNILNKI